ARNAKAVPRWGGGARKAWVEGIKARVSTERRSRHAQGRRAAHRLCVRSRYLGRGGRLFQAASEDLRQGRRDHRAGPRQHSVRRQSRLRLHRGKILWHADGVHRPAQAAVRPNPASARSGGGRFRRTGRRLGLRLAAPLAFARGHRHGAAMTIAASERDLAVVRHDWTRAEVRALFELSFPELIFRAQRIHRLHFDPTEVQISTLISIKTGGCPEDCAYCPPSSPYQTWVKAEKRMRVEAVVAEAGGAKSAGASRFCMGAAWREPKERDLDQVCDMVAGVKAIGLETCATLGMLTQRQARRLKAAGLDYYNHNLDTSPEYYGAIITTRTYQDRLATLRHVREAGIKV